MSSSTWSWSARSSSRKSIGPTARSCFWRIASIRLALSRSRSPSRCRVPVITSVTPKARRAPSAESTPAWRTSLAGTTQSDGSTRWSWARRETSVSREPVGAVLVVGVRAGGAERQHRDALLARHRPQLERHRDPLAKLGTARLEAATSSAHEARAWPARLQRARERLQRSTPELPELSASPRCSRRPRSSRARSSVEA